MAVGIEGDVDAAMSQALLDDLGVDALREHQAGGGMAEIVKANLRQAGRIENLTEDFVEFGWIDGPAQGVGEYQIPIVPIGLK